MALPMNLLVKYKTERLSNQIVSSIYTATQPGPFMIEFHSDNRYNPRVFTEAGFRIKYKID